MLLSLELWGLRILALLAILGGIWYAGDRHGHKAEEAAQAAALAAAQAQVAAVNKQLTAKAQEADHAQELNRQALEHVAAVGRSELQRLRDATTGAGSLPGSAANPGLAAYAADGDRLLAECASRYQAVDGAKASLASRLGGIQRLVQPAGTEVSAAAPPDQPASENSP